MGGGETSVGSSMDSKRPLFISYRRADNRPPPDYPKAEGYITHFCRQLSWELDNVGVDSDTLWIDRNKLEPADEFTKIIAEQLAKTDILLAILSNGYVASGWCCEEVDFFAERIQDMPDPERRRRIFRVDKQEVVDSDLPEPLRNLQAVRLYEKDPESGMEREFYYRGKLRRPTPYREAINALALAIRKRLLELRGTVRTRNPGFNQPQPTPSNGCRVFVALPAFDLEEQYSVLVRELCGRGYEVVPSGELPQDGAAALKTVREGLLECELSIHLLGEKRGFQPDGLAAGIVNLQLAEAAAEATRRPLFRRLVWAPKQMPDGEGSARGRDPLEVLARHGERLPTDEVDGDTAARFNEFVIQQLSARRAESNTARIATAAARSVYVTCLPLDQKHALETAKRLKENGIKPLLFPSDAGFNLAGRADHIAFCWGGADEVGVLDALDRLGAPAWRKACPTGKLLVLVFDRANETQRLSCEIDSFGSADSVLDANDPAVLTKYLSMLAT